MTESELRALYMLMRERSHFVSALDFRLTERSHPPGLVRADLALTLGELAGEGIEPLVTCTFEGVTGLRLRFGVGALNKLVHLGIEDVRDDGWEGVKYRITEAENDAISLYCEDARIDFHVPRSAGPDSKQSTHQPRMQASDETSA